jgi:hypothetical protein
MNCERYWIFGYRYFYRTFYRTVYRTFYRTLLVASLSLCGFCSQYSVAADQVVEVQLNSRQAGPRTIETLTERAIVRDYRSAWSGMALALESNTADPIGGQFTGAAKQLLNDTVASQRKSGLRQQYSNQIHKLEAVFYAPEGDVIELQDTFECQRQVLDGAKVVNDEHMVVHYVVLMTPSADRWVVRHLQAVQHF